MRKLFSATLLALMFAFGLSAHAQSQADFEAEFQQYMSAHGLDATRDYVISRMNQFTGNAILEEQAWAALESAFGGLSQCLVNKRQVCDAQFTQELLDITITDTIAMAACAVLTPAGAPAVVFCFAAVIIVHKQRMEAAQHRHRVCYLRARVECQAVAIIPCLNGSEDATRDIQPLIADCSAYDDPCACPPRSPIMIDVAGNGFDLTGTAGGTRFNLTGGGLELLGWTRADSDDAFLTLDVNGNGKVDDGTELFGNFTAQPEPAPGEERNGFAALRVFDYNSDGKIDSSDSVYSVLRLWQDRNHNGISEPDELQPLDKLGLRTLFLNYTRSEKVDKFGNAFRYRAAVEDFGDNQLGRWAWDVFLASGRPGAPGELQWQTTK